MGDGLPIGTRRNAVVAVTADEGGTGDALQAVEHVVLAAGLQLNLPTALLGFTPTALLSSSQFSGEPRFMRMGRQPVGSPPLIHPLQAPHVTLLQG